MPGEKWLSNATQHENFDKLFDYFEKQEGVTDPDLLGEKMAGVYKNIPELSQKIGIPEDELKAYCHIQFKYRDLARKTTKGEE